MKNTRGQLREDLIPRVFIDFSSANIKPEAALRTMHESMGRYHYASKDFTITENLFDLFWCKGCLKQDDETD